MGKRLPSTSFDHRLTHGQTCQVTQTGGSADGQRMEYLLGWQETYRHPRECFLLKEAIDDCTPELEEQAQVVKYKSFRDFPEDAAIEVDRLVEAGFARKSRRKPQRESLGRAR